MKKAFTLIELLIVIGIIAALMAALVPAISGASDSAKAAKCLSNMHQLAMGSYAVALRLQHYPLAGSVENETNDVEYIVQGWVGRDGSSYISPYSTDEDARREALSLGSMWNAVSANADVFVCPVHRDIARKQKGGAGKLGPCWSYVMSGRFGWQTQGDAYEDDYTKVPLTRNTDNYKKYRDKSKILLFAELPFLKNEIQDPVFSSGGNLANDPILQYPIPTGQVRDDCETWGEKEIIGFNHKTGKRECYAHVCYLDGHTAKFLLPSGASKKNLQDLTTWLCNPECEDEWKSNTQWIRDFDIVLRGNKYEQDNTKN